MHGYVYILMYMHINREQDKLVQELSKAQLKLHIEMENNQQVVEEKNQLEK